MLSIGSRCSQSHSLTHPKGADSASTPRAGCGADDAAHTHTQRTLTYRTYTLVEDDNVEAGKCRRRDGTDGKEKKDRRVSVASASRRCSRCRAEERYCSLRSRQLFRLYFSLFQCHSRPILSLHFLDFSRGRRRQTQIRKEDSTRLIRCAPMLLSA